MDSDSKRLARIGIASVLLAVTAFVGGRLLAGSATPEPAPPPAAEAAPPIPSEAGTFLRSPSTAMFSQAAGTPQDGIPQGRSLSTFYSRREFPGAPPVIPHKLLSSRSWGAGACLGCHRNGGYTPAFQAMAPVTPHPDWLSCVSCHVPQQDGAGQFRPTAFVPPSPPKLQGASLPGSPPPIPHDLQMRSNCLACHAGPAAVREVRTDHPERGNCRQCHVQNVAPVAAFERVQP